MHPYILVLLVGIPVPGLIILSVLAVKYRRMAGGMGGGRYVAVIWLAYSATIALCGHMANVAPSLPMAGILAMLAVGFGICYVIAVIGAMRGRKGMNH